MKFSVLIASCAALASAAPSVNIHSHKEQKRAAVFTAQTYNDLSISGGTAGKAAAEAQAKLAGLPTDLASVDEADLTFLKAVNQVANDAEVGAFNTGIAAAGVGDAAMALQRGKIKNKVLKLTATVQMLTAQEAQGQNVTAKLAEETTKLNKNIAEDTAEAGKLSTAAQFDANTSDPEATAVAKDDALATKVSDIVEASKVDIAARTIIVRGPEGDVVEDVEEDDDLEERDIDEFMRRGIEEVDAEDDAEDDVAGANDVEEVEKRDVGR